MQKEEKTFVKSLSELYQRINFLKRVSLILSLSNLVLMAILSVELQSNPIVILERDEEKLSFEGEKREIVVTDKEIKKAVEKFIRTRYEWENFNTSEIMDKLNPLLTSGLREKTIEELTSQKNSNSSISQYVGKVKITVDGSGNVIGIFDRIIRITAKIKDNVKMPSLPEKIPLLSEAQVMVKVVKGAITPENPLGIYINSVLNYETN